MKDVIVETKIPDGIDQRGLVDRVLAAFGMRSRLPNWHIPQANPSKVRSGHAGELVNRLNCGWRLGLMRSIRANRTPNDKLRRSLIQGMPNWNRNQWARAGYPQDLDKVKFYAELKR